MSETTYAGSATAHFGMEHEAKAEQHVPPKVAMPQVIAWAIIAAFAVSIVAMGAAPFVEQRYRVITGMTAAVALLLFFGLVGAVKATRGER